MRAPRPARRHWLALAVSALGTVVGFPLFLALALREVDAMHAAVVTGVLPLATAAVAALVLAAAAVGGFLGLRRGRAARWCWALPPGRAAAGWRAADGLLLLAVLSASIGYVAGARVSAVMPAQQVICWVLVGSLPFTLPAVLWLWPAAPVRGSGLGLGFGYAAVFSMWLGFFAWYRGLALGGVVRVSQVQLLQPFLALLFAVPVLGERLDPMTVLFSLAVIGGGVHRPAHAGGAGGLMQSLGVLHDALPARHGARLKLEVETAMKRRFHQLDVFTAVPLKGNPLAVVHDAQGLSDAQMAAFARWTNLSETTFLLPPTDPAADYRVRIFTPGGELPFAGHPTLGSCHAWLAAGGVPRDAGRGGAGVRRRPGARARSDGARLAFAAPPLRRSGPLASRLLQRSRGRAGPARAATCCDHQWVDNGPGWWP